MLDKDSNLPPLPDEAFDGDKYSIEVKHERCQHDVYMDGQTLRCKKCGAGWRGPQIAKLYEAFKKTG